jgi:hypothetical protein
MAGHMGVAVDDALIAAVVERSGRRVQVEPVLKAPQRDASGCIRRQQAFALAPTLKAPVYIMINCFQASI